MADKSVEYYQQQLRKAQGNATFAENNGDTNQKNIFGAKLEAAKLDLARAEAAAAGSPPSNSVATSTSPAAQTAQAPANTAGNQTVQQSQPPAQPAQTPTPTPLPPQVERTTSIPVGETRETVLGGYESEARAEATATRLIEREQSDARAQGREPANYEVVETTDDGFVVQKVTDAPATPAQTGFVGGRGSVVEQPGERAAAAVPATPQDTGYSDPFSEGGDVQDIGENQIQRSPNETTDEDYYSDPLSEGADVTVTDESTVIRDPNAPIVENGRVINDTPDPLDEAAAGFGGFVEDDVALDVAGGLQTTPTQVDDTQAQDQQQVPRTSTQTPTPQQTEDERAAEINQAALDRLRKQSAAEQNRKPQGTGDWRVKLRLASGAPYFYNSIIQAGDDVKRTAGILAPLQATDGIIFPYTPSIQILYAADYNTYHPTHSNYQHYFYKGSKVGEVVLTATFTAQDTEEANYLLAVIHFLKSASKMFYGQDPERGSPPPLLFLTGLGDYQFNEAPCVISQFNYVLPNDVDYIRSQVQQIRAGTLQYDLRNKNTGAALTSWSSSINRVLTTPGLTIGAENPTSRISSQTANLSTENATYVPTKMEMTITLLPVQNRLQVSEGFSLKEYANGDLIKGGFW